MTPPPPPWVVSLLFALLLFAPEAHAFAAPPAAIRNYFREEVFLARLSMDKSNDKDNVASGRFIPTTRRRGALQQTAWLLLSAAVAVAVQPAAAAAEAGDTLADKVAVAGALRTLKQCVKASQSPLEDYVQLQEYESIQSALRTPPLSELRKTCNRLMTTQEPLQDLYRRDIIPPLEALDAAALQGVRGKKGVDLNTPYQSFCQGLQRFQNVVLEAQEKENAAPAPAVAE